MVIIRASKLLLNDGYTYSNPSPLALDQLMSPRGALPTMEPSVARNQSEPLQHIGVQLKL